MVTVKEPPKAPPRSRKHLEDRLGAAAWGVFFLWVGFALLADVSMGIGLVGVGVITLLAQTSRKIFRLAGEGVWFVVGVGFVLAGLWNVLALDAPLAPILLLVVGTLLLGTAAIGRRSRDDGKGEDDGTTYVL